MLREKREECQSNPNPLKPPDHIESDIQALRAVARKCATGDQQKQAMDFIIKILCRTYDVSFHPNSERLSNFAEGMRQVGVMLQYFIDRAPTTTEEAKIAARVMGTKQID